MPTEASRDLAGKAIDIKGKRYVLVSDRVLAFNQDYPRGSITTEMLSTPEADTVVFKATVKPDTDRTFIGHSQATWGDGYINKTSALENAETSAVGRALAFMGIGVLDSIASVDEINKANGQPSKAEIVERKKKELADKDFQDDYSWRVRIGKCATVADFNGLFPDVASAPDSVKKWLMQKANACGFWYDKSACAFYDPKNKLTNELEASLLQSPQESPAPRTPSGNLPINTGLQSEGRQGQELISQAQLIKLQKARKDTKISDVDYRNILGRQGGVTSSTELQKANFQPVLDAILDHSKIGV